MPTSESCESKITQIKQQEHPENPFIKLPFQTEEHREERIQNLAPFHKEEWVKEVSELMKSKLKREIENLEQELQKSKKVIAKLMKRNRIMGEFYNQTLDREEKLKKELDAIKWRAEPNVQNKRMFENLREAFNPKLKSNEPKKKPSTSSSSKYTLN